MYAVAVKNVPRQKVKVAEDIGVETVIAMTVLNVLYQSTGWMIDFTLAFVKTNLKYISASLILMELCVDTKVFADQWEMTTTATAIGLNTQEKTVMS